MKDPKKTKPIGEEFVTKLIEEKFRKMGIKRIRCDTRLYASSIPKIWSNRYTSPIPVLQPQIDIILRDGEDEQFLNAIEVKYFRVAGNEGFNYPYYIGMDQAIAYLRFGFDYVALWHLFDGNKPIEEFKDYGYRVWNFLREFSLPIEFSYGVLQKNDQGSSYSIRLFKNNIQDDYTLTDDLSSIGHLGWKDEHRNPYRNTEEGKKLRRVIEEWLANKWIKGG